ncbi:MAG: cytochrome P450 [Myxacorys chilensis ATA2-1-KO14]|jgi:fatty-acid peroxygenase|nr:cytochrome P450 [Myxacorys chilensis ATA2-1-KO14]
MQQIPRDKALDSTLALLLDGYLFIPKRCQRYQSDIFQARLLFQPSICMTGKEAATLFYDTERFERKDANPEPLKKTLIGEGSVLGLDGNAHRRRKQMFMSLMTRESIQHLAALTTEQWHAYSKKWEMMDKVVLLYEVRQILCRAVCQWTGVPLEEGEVKQRTNELAALFEGGGSAGLRHLRGRIARQQTEKWIEDIIENVRSHTLEVAEGSPVHAIAWHRDLNEELLDKRTAAIELINLLRPTVAIAQFVIFSALALHDHPDCRQTLQQGDDKDVERFVQEVRRFYPFFPLIAARVRQDFDWNGYHFPKKTRVFLDLYGTNHDARLWENPDEFQPERFRHWDGSPFNFIPQGGGDYQVGHRCAGEWITIELMKASVKFLTQSIQYDVPEQDLRISLSRIPAIPKSRFIISNVRRTD